MVLNYRKKKLVSEFFLDKYDRSPDSELTKTSQGYCIENHNKLSGARRVRDYCMQIPLNRIVMTRSGGKTCPLAHTSDTFSQTVMRFHS